MSRLETIGFIETRDVAVRAECPYCGYETRRSINDFDYTDLWYGQESICCDECEQTYNLYHVERY